MGYHWKFNRLPVLSTELREHSSVGVKSVIVSVARGAGSAWTSGVNVLDQRSDHASPDSQIRGQ